MKKVLFIVTLLLVCISFTSNKIPKDATVFQGHYYKIFDDTLSWKAAEQKCNAMGGMLASVKSEAVNDFIFKLSKGKCLWLGASDELKENEWLWRDGTPITYSNWAAHEPDNWFDGKEHWLVINWPSKEYKNGKWGDTQLHYRKQINGYVCEWVEK